MTWSTLGATLRRIGRVLRKLLAGVQPWDWDKPPRHWWDVYNR